MRWISILIYSSALVAGTTALAAQPAPGKAETAKTAMPPAAVPQALLPVDFAGWVSAKAPTALAEAAQADPANAAALKEYDITSAATANYKRSGETLSLRLLRFHDASGAFGAYSFYRQNGWPKEQIGSGATSHHNRVLFWVGNTLVDANFSHIGPMSGAELRELAAQLPKPEGSRALAPPILANLPQGSLDGQTTHYTLGPAGYVGSGGVLPPELVGFDRGAEVVTANYTLRSGAATLTIIDYPTPQMGAATEPKIRAYIDACKAAGNSKSGNAQPGNQSQTAWIKPLADSDLASLEVRRSGPIVALVTGDAIPEESHKLLFEVHYEPELMSIPQPMESETAKTGKLLMGIAVLVIIGASAAIALGFFLGSFRALYRMVRGKPASSVYDLEFISLNLRDEKDESQTSDRSGDEV